MVARIGAMGWCDLVARIAARFASIELHALHGERNGYHDHIRAVL